jgi:hypothetical protein
MLVKISEDFSKVMFSSGQEHYILDQHSQNSFHQLKDKKVRNVINHKNSFYLVSCKEYDRDIDILNSDDPEFNASIKRNIEPGLVKVFDSMIYQSKESEILKILIVIGD